MARIANPRQRGARLYIVPFLAINIKQYCLQQWHRLKSMSVRKIFSLIWLLDNHVPWEFFRTLLITPACRPGRNPRQQHQPGFINRMEVL